MWAVTNSWKEPAASILRVKISMAGLCLLSFFCIIKILCELMNENSELFSLNYQKCDDIIVFSLYQHYMQGA
jgi:hypothetical protein